MSQAQNVTDFYLSRSATQVPSFGGNPASSSMWFLEPNAPTNVAFDTFNETTPVSTGLPQQMSPASTPPVDFAVWGIYFPAIPGQGQAPAAYGKIQLYGTRVAVAGGQGNDPTNATSEAAVVALANSIGQKYEIYSANDTLPNGFGSSAFITVVDVVTQVQSVGGIISLNGAPLYII
jgi:hypothetical protein